MTPYADYIDTVGGLIRKLLGDIPIIIGGYHATIFKTKIFEENKYVDYVIVGDAEESLVRLLENIKSGHTSDAGGVYSRNNRNNNYGVSSVVVDNQERYRSLDHVPFPDEEVIHPEYYSISLRNGHSSVPEPSRYVLYSRGCPFWCSFCKIENNEGFRSKVRFYSPKLVVEHLGSLVERYHLKGVAFLDDNFTLNKKWAYEVCEGIVKNKIKIKWWAQIRANLFDFDLMRFMRNAGCCVATITIESGNDRIRREVFRKEITREQIKNTYWAAKKLGMLVQGTLMLGAPTETKEECLDSINFLREMDPDWAGIVFTTPLPGTSMYEMLKNEIKVRCYRDYDILLQAEHYSSNEVKLAFHRMHPAFILKTYREIKKEYDYNNRVKLSLRNFMKKERFYWMLRYYKKLFKSCVNHFSRSLKTRFRGVKAVYRIE